MVKTLLQQKIFLEFLLGNPEHYPFNRNIKKKQIFLCCGETENVVAILIPTTLQYYWYYLFIMQQILQHVLVVPQHN